MGQIRSSLTMRFKRIAGKFETALPERLILSGFAQNRPKPSRVFCTFTANPWACMKSLSYSAPHNPHSVSRSWYSPTISRTCPSRQFHQPVKRHRRHRNTSSPTRPPVFCSNSTLTEAKYDL